jgi:hypothetical protein
MKTVSIWTDVLEMKDQFKNTFYNFEATNKTLFPNFAMYKLRFWEEYFLKYNPNYTQSNKKKMDNFLNKSSNSTYS